MYAVGLDIGSSSVKAALVEIATQRMVAQCSHPNNEMAISSPRSGYAEQDPDFWWLCVCTAIKKLITLSGVPAENVESIGIAYQMHGLVLVDHSHHVLRPAIIWCDSRAVEIGDRAFHKLGAGFCLHHYLNSPGNFTASKMRWVINAEPDIARRTYKLMLPGDFIAMKLTGEIATTVCGLSEGVLWDFRENEIAQSVLDVYDIPADCIPGVVPTFGPQGNVTSAASKETGLSTKTVVSYRAGDQPNNALSLGAYLPGAVAASGGTSGVIYGVTDNLNADLQSRINSFAHVNHSHELPRIGQLLCINGAGILYAWLKRECTPDAMDYQEMEQAAASVPVGSDGLRILPFGNGAERVLGNRTPGAEISGLRFNDHTTGTSSACGIGRCRICICRWL